MPEPFSYHMATAYQKAFKEFLTYTRLYETLDNEQPYSTSNSFTSREIFERRDSSGILNKSKKLLRLDIKSYATNDPEQFNVLKLMYFLFHTCYPAFSSQKSISIIDLIANPSLEHTDSPNAVYGEKFAKDLAELRQGVSHPEYREKEIERIADHWQYLQTHLCQFAMGETHTKTDELKRAIAELQFFIEEIQKNGILESKHEGENVIDTFYNIMLSSRIIAKVEDCRRSSYEFPDANRFTPKVIALNDHAVFSEHMTWESFFPLIDKKHIDLENESIHHIWSFLLLKESVTMEDIIRTSNSSYQFAIRFAPEVSELWKSKKKISVLEWIIIVQELMSISEQKTSYTDRYIRYYGSGKHTLTSAVKLLSQAPELPKQILIKRLTLRFLLSIGAKDVIQDLIQADKCLLKLIQLIFSPHSIETKKYLHHSLYPIVFAIFTSSFEFWITLYSLNADIFKVLSAKRQDLSNVRVEPNFQIYHRLIICLLCWDKPYRRIRLPGVKEIVQEGIHYMSKVKALSMEDENFKKAIEINRQLPLVEGSLDTLVNELADEIIYLYDTTQNYKREPILSRIFTIPIYLGEDLNYLFCVRFLLHKQTNKLDILWLGNLKDSPDTSSQLPAPR